MSSRKSLQDEVLLKESVFIVGRVCSIEGRKVKIKVNKDKNLSHLSYNGEIVKNVSVGSYIKIVKGFVEIIGKVEGEFVTKEKVFNEDYKKEELKIARYLEVSLFGHFDGSNFRQGVKEMPLIDNECYLLGKKEFNRLHQFYKTNEATIEIGSLSEEPSQRIMLSIRKLFANHIGIFGNTGSGKSNTLAKIYSEFLKKIESVADVQKKANFLLIDFSGEYARKECLTESKKIYNLSTGKKLIDIKDEEKFPINERDLIDLELISILANATEKTQKPFISRALELYKRVQKEAEMDPGVAADLNYFKNLIKKKIREILKMSDKEKSYLLIDYLKIILIDESESNDVDFMDTIDWNNKNHHFMPRGGDSRDLTDAEIEATTLMQSVDSYAFPKDLLTKIIHFLYLQIILDVYQDRAQNEHIAPAINKLKSKRKDIDKVLNTKFSVDDPYKDYPLVVLNLDDVNLDMKKVIPLLIVKKKYNEHKRKKDAGRKDSSFLNIIIDEAHNILSDASFREAESWKDYRLETFEEIIKEGRKYGVFLTIASQRPYDISPTIISQLHNYFIHRLINENDIKAIEKTVAYLDKLSFESIPVLPVGSCFVAGLASDIPIKVDVEVLPPEEQPRSSTINLDDLFFGVQ